MWKIKLIFVVVICGHWNIGMTGHSGICKDKFNRLWSYSIYLLLLSLVLFYCNKILKINVF